MKFSFFLLSELLTFISSSISNYKLLKDDFLDILNNGISNSIIKDEIIEHFEDFLNKYFENFNKKDINKKEAFKKCSYKIFNKTNNIYNYLYLFSYSGKEFSDLGLQSECINQGFSYYLLSFNYNISLREENNIYEFLEQNKFYIGLCLFNECDELIKILFNTNSTFLNNLYNGSIIKIINNEKLEFKNNEEKYLGKPYYTLNEFGLFDETLTKKEEKKYKIFFILFIITISILGIELLIGILINCGYNIYYDYNKTLSKELKIDNENDEEEDNLEETNDQIIFLNNPSSQDDKKETISQKLIKIMAQYFSLFTNIIILIIKKSKYYNNKNMGVIAKLRIISLLLITYSANFDVLIKISSKVFHDISFYKEIYFCFFKFASFGIDMYIILDGFETMYKLMNYYKKNYYDKENKTINFLGIIKFYLYSFYRIFSFIILFFIVNYFNRYFIYFHNGEYGEALYFYYSNNIISKNNIVDIFNPKYTILSYFFRRNKNIDKFISEKKMSLLFVNEFYIFTIFLIIFYIGNILKSKIYDYILLIYIIISYILTYFICQFNTYDDDQLYTYKKITRNILLIKYPHILFNHYIMGAFTGLICFYSKDSNTKKPMSNDREKCPYKFCVSLAVIFDYIMQVGRKLWIFIGFCIQIFICSTFSILLYLNKKKNNENLSLDFISTLKIIYYYESGLFIFIFCLVIILLFAKEKNPKTTENFNILNLVNSINFSYANTVYLMTYSYYCLFNFQLKLTYQNLWFITFGIFIFFSLENILLTIIFVLPFKIIFKTLSDRFIILNKSSLHLDEIRYKNNNAINNNGIDDYNNDEDSN